MCPAPAGDLRLFLKQPGEGKGHVNCDEEKQGHTVTLSSPAPTDTGRPLAAAYEELQEEIRGFTSGNCSAVTDNVDLLSSYANRR